MTRTDHKIIFTALGFVAVLLENKASDNLAARARTLAGLIESFCAESVPEARLDHVSEKIGAGVTTLPESKEHSIKMDLLHQAMAALELCVEEGGLTFSSEQEADRVIARIKRSSLA